MIQTYQIGKGIVALLKHKIAVQKVPIFLNTEDLVDSQLSRTVSYAGLVFFCCKAQLEKIVFFFSCYYACVIDTPINILHRSIVLLAYNFSVKGLHIISRLITQPTSLTPFLQ